MKFGSVCSGIEAASVAWNPLGWQCGFAAEIEKFPCAVLKERWPETINLGDMNEYKSWPDIPIDVLVGGTPCQDFSVAGLRAGMAGARGGLTMRFLDVARRYAPRWICWENVPGILSIDEGRAFGTFLGGLARLGYGFAYRILDAQYFGLAQRRERVFVVGHLGDWRRAAAVLFERESMSGHPSPRRETGKGTTHDIAPSLTGSGRGVERTGESRGQDPVVGSLCEDSHPGSYSGQAAYTGRLVAHSLRADGFDASEDGTGRGTPLVPIAIQERAVSENPNNGPDGKGWQESIAYTMEARNKVQAVAFSEKDYGGPLKNGGGKPGQGYPEIQSGMQVRRLTPRECERLQGFPDDYTLINYRGKPACDGPRYKALGNSMAVPVMHWIGRRIALVDSFTKR